MAVPCAHNAGEFANDSIHINTAESFNATLKRAHTGVYHYMSAKHLLRYVSEAMFRWNGRKTDTLGRLSGMIMAGQKRHLSYKTLVAHDGIEPSISV